MRFTIDVSKENVEPLSLFFHSWEHNGKKFDADPGIVQKLAIAIRKAICSVLFIKAIESVDELKAELKKESKTNINIEMTLNDVMNLLAAFSPDSKNKADAKEKGEKVLTKISATVDNIIENMDSADEMRFH